MPESKKRVVENKEAAPQKHYNVVEKGKGGRILVTILCLGMVGGLLFAAIYLMIINLAG
ncbi:MAG: hypothetical protein H6687_02010 [Bacillales bacterium]|nr:hypothetical protein [Bacillales bacterium]